ncbi:MAG: FKBP-type peptidyl-prolyl cis-trans isomerase [Bacteroidota bacterium]|nr:FKBP-type peptidyl-prolyl cis-trans isomerase [Bacteroidota bacterium]
MMNIHQLAFLFVLFTAGYSCGDNHKKTTKKTNLNSKEFQDRLIEANKMYVKRESDEIDQYAKHKNWEMITTGTGLRYMITKKGTGEIAALDEKFDIYAKVNYKVYLLDGTLCYSSDSLGAYEFLIGHDHVERGLHEGIQYLHVGDQAIFILPSHLAHGLMGDQGKIPAKSSVRYDIDLLGIRKVTRKN